MDNEKLFKKFGMNDLNVKRILKNDQKCSKLREVLLECSLKGKIPVKIGSLMLELGTYKGISDVPKTTRLIIIDYIVKKKISKKLQIDEAVKFFKNVKLSETGTFTSGSQKAEFHKACGVGIKVTSDEIEKKVDEFLSTFTNDDLMTTPQSGIYVKKIKVKYPKLKWSEGKTLFECVEKTILKRLGFKDMKTLIKSNKKLKKSKRNLISSMKFQVRHLKIAENSKEVMEKHKRETGGKIRTRFPPEPNGYLHIGHAKAMAFDFGLAREKGGICFLRYDDTNPEAESQEYIDAIKEMVLWMGYKPDHITFASDYFDIFYEHAITLIKKSLAYVDFSTQKEIKEQRGSLSHSPYREKYSVEENLKLFNDMRIGKFEEGECILRCKIDSKSANPNMRDFIAYRIKYVEHPHNGDKWCIYPTYDYTHCIEDSIENITHSMCTLEFETRRDSYYWLLDALNVYKPFVWEFSRMNVSTSLLSKRKINALVKKEIVSGFDDPRLMTLAGLRRRGYTPQIIREFCLGTGASRSTNTLVKVEKLEHVCRGILDKTCKRVFCILKPLKVTILDDDLNVKEYEVPNHPTNKKMGKRKLPFTNLIYIERTDFRMLDDKNFYGLAPNKVVGLRYGPNIKCVDVVRDFISGKIYEIKCTVDWEKKEKPKGHIHWLAVEPNVKPLNVEIRLFDRLLTKDSLDKGDDVMDYINKDSKKVLKGCMIESKFRKKENRTHLKSFQFERTGYFTVDYDSDDTNLVFNSIIPLKKSKESKNL